MRILFSFLTLFLTISLFAESSYTIDERKTDIYFANGVGAISYKNSFNQGYNQIKKYKAENHEIYKHYVGKYDLSFNTGHGILMDMFEAWIQYTDENIGASFSWSAFKELLGRIPVAGTYANGTVTLTEAVAKTHEAKDIIELT
jgi:hypothetical protein